MDRKHVMVIAYPAFGHYIPCLELAWRIQQFHDVTVVISASRESEIRERGLIPPPPIRFLPVSDGLPLDLNTSASDRIAAIAASRSCYDELICCVSSSQHSEIPPVDAVICDYTLSLLTEASSKLGFPIYGFFPFSAKFLGKSLQYHENAQTVSDDEFYKGPKHGQTFFSAMPESFKILGDIMIESSKIVSGLLVNTYKGMEREAIENVAKHPDFAHLFVKPIGPLISNNEYTDAQQENVGNFEQEWLSTYPNKSVVYVSLGSAASVPAEQLVQIAEALLALNIPFIWSLPENQQEFLPEPLIYTNPDDLSLHATYLMLPWAPQKTILAHPAIAVFVSHCGWNSALEAVAFGVPVCGWPLLADQFLNALLLEEKGLAVILRKRGMETEEVVPAVEIIRGIERVTGWDRAEDGWKFAEAAVTFRATETLGPDGDSTRNFLEVMRSF